MNKKTRIEKKKVNGAGFDLRSLTQNGDEIHIWFDMVK